MDVAIIAFAIITVISIKKTQKPFSLDKDSTNIIKGICCICVVLGHLGQILSGGFITETFLVIQLLGLPVPIFFFLSGYGMTCSLRSKCNGNDYWKKYAKKKFFSLLLPLLFSGICYFIILQIIVSKMNFFTAINKSWTDLKNGYTITLNAWYVYLLVLFCIMFFALFFTYKKNESKKVTVIRILFVVLMITVVVAIMLFVLDWGGWWSKACYAFPAGVIWGFYNKYLEKFIAKFSKPILIFSIVLYVSPWLCEKIIKIDLVNKMATPLRFVSSSIVVVLLLLFLFKFRFDSAIFANIGKYSLEIYLFHGLVYSVLGQFEKLKQLDFLFVLIVLLVSYLISIPAHLLFQKIKNVAIKPVNS